MTIAKPMQQEAIQTMLYARALSTGSWTLSSGCPAPTGSPTWPWRSGKLTGFLSALVLPILLFVIQLGIQKWLSKWRRHSCLSS